MTDTVRQQSSSQINEDERFQAFRSALETLMDASDQYRHFMGRAITIAHRLWREAPSSDSDAQEYIEAATKKFDWFEDAFRDARDVNEEHSAVPSDTLRKLSELFENDAQMSAAARAAINTLYQNMTRSRSPAADALDSQDIAMRAS